jgi:cytochrome c-type biogenesis protein CcmH
MPSDRSHTELRGHRMPMTREFSSKTFLRTAIAVVFAALLASVPVARAQDTPRGKALAQKLMCVCGCNQLLGQCNHVDCPYSPGMIKEVNSAVARNESDDLTLQGFVQEYGPNVLSEPPAKGFNWAAWIVPIVAPLLAFYVLWEVVRRWRQRAALSPAGGPPVSPEFLARAKDESNRGFDE